MIESFPRTELFSADTETMRRTAVAVLGVGLRRQVRLFLRSDAYGRFVACMVYLPRDRYTTAVRLEMQEILVAELGGVDIDYSARVSESELASVYFTVTLPGEATGGPPPTPPRTTGCACRTCSTRPATPGTTGSVTRSPPPPCSIPLW